MRWCKAKKRRSWRSSATPTAPPYEDLILAPIAGAVAHLADDVKLDVLVPPYPCAGVGVLRIVRVIRSGSGAQVRVTASYEDYMRLP